LIQSLLGSSEISNDIIESTLLVEVVDGHDFFTGSQIVVGLNTFSDDVDVGGDVDFLVVTEFVEDVTSLDDELSFRGEGFDGGVSNIQEGTGIDLTSSNSVSTCVDSLESGNRVSEGFRDSSDVLVVKGSPLLKNIGGICEEGKESTHGHLQPLQEGCFQ